MTPAFDVSRSTGLLGIVAGLTSLCGWSVLPSYVIRHLWFVSQVHPNAALGFILVGFSLRLARYDGATAFDYERGVYFDPFLKTYRVYSHPVFARTYREDREERIRVVFKDGKAAVIEQAKD